jgi:gliding motility-associated lipoprotein GldH
MRYIFLGLFSISLLFCACSKDNYAFSKEFAQANWFASDTLRFAQKIDKPTTLSADIHYNDDYAFRNIYLKISVQSPSGKWADTLLCDTIMDNLGAWRVERAGNGYKIPMRQSLNLTEKGEYHFKMIQYMRKDTLGGVTKVGFNLKWF